jgi:hypothetical protein
MRGDQDRSEDSARDREARGDEEGSVEALGQRDGDARTAPNAGERPKSPKSSDARSRDDVCETKSWMPAAPANSASRPASQVNPGAAAAAVAVAQFAVHADG